MTGQEPAKLRAVIVDDEPLARERIRTLLGVEADVEVVAECESGSEAVEAIREAGPDLVFLDVQMPGVDGLAALRALPPDRLPMVIFVTAYDQYAVQAFDVHAVDYLLKPFSARRFRTALERARSGLRTDAAGVGRQLMALLDQIGERRRYLKQLVVRSSGRVVFVTVDDIDWIEAQGNYVRLHVGPATHMLRDTMKNIESCLDPDRFVRIHRSTIVQSDRIRELQPLFHGEYAVILRDGTRLTASRGPDNKLRQLLESSTLPR